LAEYLVELDFKLSIPMVYLVTYHFQLLVVPLAEDHVEHALVGADTQFAGLEQLPGIVLGRIGVHPTTFIPCRRAQGGEQPLKVARGLRL